MKSDRSIFSADMQALSVFRILFGLILFADFIIGFLPTREDFYSETGFMPHELIEFLNNHPGRVSFLFWFPQPFFLEIFTWIYGCLICFFIVGYQTKYVKFLLFAFYTSMYYRAFPAMMGADSLMRLFLLWSLFVPLNRYWSIDSALRLTPRTIPVAPVFMAGIKMQIAMLYFFSGMFKVFGHDWWNGSAVAHAMQDTNNGTVLGDWIATHIIWFSPLVSLPVMLFQLSFSLLIYSPVFNNMTRGFALLGAAMMHTAFIILLSVGLFPHVCLSYLVLLVPDAWWNKLFVQRRARLERITLYTDPGCAFCDKVARLLREACLSPFTPIQTADKHPDIHALLQQHQSWVVVDKHTDTLYLKWEAVAFVLRQSPLTYPLGYLSNLDWFKPFFSDLYDRIGRHRSVLGLLSRYLLPYDNRLQHPASLWMKAVCMILIIVMIGVNFASVPVIAKNYPGHFIQHIARFLQVYQKWDLFAPSISQWVYEFRLTGRTEKAQIINLWPLLEGKVDFDETGRLITHNERWHKYIIRITDENKNELADQFLRTMCRIYHSKQMQNKNDRLEEVTYELKLHPLKGQREVMSKHHSSDSIQSLACDEKKGIIP